MSHWKLLVASSSSASSPSPPWVLTAAGRIGVAVSSGLEALASFTRQCALVLRPDWVFAKVDYKNAFNRVYQKAIAATAQSWRATSRPRA